MADKDLWKLVAGPIQAINEAEHNNALQFAELLSELAFDSSSEEKSQKLRELSFKTTVTDELGTPQEQLVSIPLLQLVPIGGVTVDKAKLTYSLRARTDDSSMRERNNSMTRELPRFIGDLGQKSGETSDDGNISLEVELKQIDLPGGLLDALNITRARLNPVEEKDPEPDPEPDPNDDEEKYHPSITVSPFESRHPVFKPDQSYTFTFGVTQNEPIKEKLRLKVTSLTSRAVRLLEPLDEIVLDKTVKFEVFISTSKDLNKLNVNTKIGLRFEATGVDSGLTTKALFLFQRSNPRRDPNPVL